jgi:hypothetical protein
MVYVPNQQLDRERAAQLPGREGEPDGGEGDGDLRSVSSRA